MNDARADYKELLVIAVNEDKTISWRHSGMPISRLIYVMAVGKNNLLNNDNSDTC